MLSETQHFECVQETLQDLREDVALIQLALWGAHASIDKLTLSCLLRLSDYLKQHVEDLVVLCGKQHFCAPTNNAQG